MTAVAILIFAGALSVAGYAIADSVGSVLGGDIL